MYKRYLGWGKGDVKAVTTFSHRFINSPTSLPSQAQGITCHTLSYSHKRTTNRKQPCRYQAQTHPINLGLKTTP